MIIKVNQNMLIQQLLQKCWFSNILTNTAGLSTPSGCLLDMLYYQLRFVIWWAELLYSMHISPAFNVSSNCPWGHRSLDHNYIFSWWTNDFFKVN